MKQANVDRTNTDPHTARATAATQRIMAKCELFPELVEILKSTYCYLWEDKYASCSNDLVAGVQNVRERVDTVITKAEAITKENV